MRVPLSWLADYVDLDLEPEALAERLTLLGMEVRSVERWGADWRNVVVGELLTVDRHPRADRLSLTTVTTGQGEPLSIVCGATNIAPGQRVPVALPGAVLPGDRRIERTEKMGVVSNGMLCSGDELHLTGDAEGIIILPPDTPLGVALVDLYGDVVLDIDVKPNRGDALSMIGLAREVAAVTGGEVRFPPFDVEEGSEPIADHLSVTIEDADLCPRFVGRRVAAVRIGPSPDRIQMRLLAAGMRPISNVVDASNYVMHELGKPIHTFDGDAVRDGRVIVRLARPGERLETLDHVDRELTPDTLLIADPSGPLAIAGIMGGAASEVGDGTANVIIESAIFDPVNIRRSAFRYALRSEASLRFEKGQETRLARIGADRTARLIHDWAGGTVAAGVIDTAPDEPAPARVAFRPGRVDRLLGASLDADEQRSFLARVGIATEPAAPATPVPVAGDPEPLTVMADEPVVLAVVPTWRRDIAIEADIAEEVARVRGYELTPSILPDTPMPPYRPSSLEVRDAVRSALVGAGLTEVVTHALVSPADIERFPAPPDPAPPGEGDAGGDPIVVLNPLSREHSVLRRALLGSLLGVVGANRRQGHEDIAIFEIGKGYGRRGDVPIEWWRLGFALAGGSTPPHWAERSRPVDLDDGKGIIELICRILGWPMPRYVPEPADPNLHPGRSATVEVRTDDALRMSGRVGEIHPALLEALDLRVPRVVAAEVAVDGLAGGRLSVVRAIAPSRHPAVERDLAVVVGEAVPIARVAETIEAAAGEHLESLRLFDVYRGTPLGPDERSLAFRLVFRAPDRTLTEEEIESTVQEVTGRLAGSGGRLRA
jgi:phenylalanyl-tRNA synthetase beta chain